MRKAFRMAAAVALMLTAVVSMQAAAQAQSEASRKALESAAAKGSLAAQYALASAAESEGDLERALTLYSAAAEAGYPGAQFKLGEMFRLGRGVPEDLGKATEWYQKAANQGLAQAIEALKRTDNTAAEPTKAVDAPSPTSNAEATGAAPSADPTNKAAEASSEPRQTAPAANPPSEPVPNGVATNAASSTLQNAAFFSPILVGLPIGFMTWRVVRGMVMRWYRCRLSVKR